MYTDLLDTVRFAKDDADKAKVYAEGVLYHALLNGAMPIFSVPQVFDSSLTLQLGENDDFIEAFYRGYLRVSLYGKEVESITGYMLHELDKSIRLEQVTFRFSSMPFFEGYNDPQLIEIYKDIRKAMAENKAFRSGIINPGDVETVDRYLRCIRKIDTAIQEGNNRKGYFLHSPGQKFTFKDAIVQHIKLTQQALRSDDSPNKNDSVQGEFNEICSRLLQLHETTKERKYNDRTINYHAVEAWGYSDASIAAAKALIDYCYNLAVASSIPDDGEEDILGLSKAYPFLVNAAESFPLTVSYADPEMFSLHLEKTPLTWETMNVIAEEVKAIRQGSAGLSWQDARQKYESRQTWLPYRTAAHAGAATMALFVPSTLLGLLPIGAAIGLVIDFAWGLLSEVADEKIKKPSIMDVIRSFQSNKKKREILKRYTVDTAFFVDT